MAGLPQFLISTQTDPYWEIPFLDAAGNPLSVAGRVFEAWIAPATAKTGIGEPAAPIKVLTFQDGLSLVPPTDGSGNQAVRNTFVHRVSRAFAQANFPRGELTADLLEVVDGARRLLVPVRLRYDDPAAIRDFVADRAGVIFGAGRQPIVTPVAVAGQAGRRGSGFLTGTQPPQPSDGEDADYWIVDRSAQGKSNLVYGPKEDGDWPAQPSSALGVGGIADVPGLPGALDGKVQAQGGAASALVVAPNYGATLPAQPRNLDLLVGVERIVLENALLATESLNAVDVPLNRILQRSAGKCIVLPAFATHAYNPIVSPGRCAFIGAGSGIGPSPAAHNNTASSVILAHFAADTLTVNSDEACIFLDVATDVWPGFRTGSFRGIRIAPLSNANSTSHILRNVRSSNRATPFDLVRSTKLDISKCWADGWTVAGFAFTNAPTSGNQEASPGNIIGNMSWGAGETGAGYYCESGYADLILNHALNGAYAVDLAVKLFPAGAFRAMRNTFEEQFRACFRLRSLDGNIASMLALDDNELSIVGTAANFEAYIVVEDSLGNGLPWLTTGSIRRNTFRGQINGGTTKAKHIHLKGKGSANVVIEQNDLENINTGTPDGIVVEGGTGNVARDNRFYGAFARKYAGAADAPLLVRHGDPVPVSALATSFVNLASGSEVAVTDGTPRSVPLKSGGPGTKASRRDGAWVGGGEPQGAAGAFTPSVSATSGTIAALGAVTGSAQVDGKYCDVDMQIKINDNGNASGNLVVTLPYTPAKPGFFLTREIAVNGVLMQCSWLAGNPTMYCTNALTGGYPAVNGSNFLLNGRYQIA